MRIGASLKRLAVIAALAAAGCETSATTSVAPSASRCGVTLSVQPAAFAASGGRGTVSVGTNRECAWDARSESAWLAVSSDVVAEVSQPRLAGDCAPNNGKSFERRANCCQIQHPCGQPHTERVIESQSRRSPANRSPECVAANRELARDQPRSVERPGLNPPRRWRNSGLDPRSPAEGFQEHWPGWGLEGVVIEPTN